ncbi:MAG: dihydroorotate dehydrogenase electron transfer subunit [Bacteroidales bacterium]|nr:dihydroorotate dehydrogenase electron transfer subunit [Bacteroidales bacterium]
MKKNITDFRVVSNEMLSSRLFLMKLTPADGSALAATHPGQFAELRVDQEPKVFLRRPISIHRVLPAQNEIWLLVQKAGNGTNHLATLKAGDVMNMVYPLGNGYTLPSAGSKAKVLLVGGGVGIAPILETGAVLKEMGCEVTYLLGGRTATDLVEIDEYRAIGEVLVTTEDGSTIEGLDCQKGFVTNHTRLQSGSFNYIKVCGPGPMMKAVAKAVAEWPEMNEVERFLELSLENKMACGLGVCLCCVEDTKEGHKCVCSDGPVFDVKDLKW